MRNGAPALVPWLSMLSTLLFAAFPAGAFAQVAPVKLSLLADQVESVYAPPEAPQQEQGTNQGGVNLNLTVGGRGRLTGNILRNYNSTRSITFATGAGGTPRSELDYWNGSLQFSWSL